MTEYERIQNFRAMAPEKLFGDPELTWLIHHRYFCAPASTKYHETHEGGLYDHSVAVYDELYKLTDRLDLKWKRKESPFIIAMLHDLCKVDQYKPNLENDGHGFVWADPFVTGHGAKSVMYASFLVKLTEEEAYCIRYHMGAFEQDDIKAYGKAVELFPNVLYTHTADMFASHMRGI